MHPLTIAINEAFDNRFNASFSKALNNKIQTFETESSSDERALLVCFSALGFFRDKVVYFVVSDTGTKLFCVDKDGEQIVDVVQGSRLQGAIRYFLEELIASGGLKFDISRFLNYL